MIIFGSLRNHVRIDRIESGGFLLQLSGRRWGVPFQHTFDVVDNLGLFDLIEDAGFRIENPYEDCHSDRVTLTAFSEHMHIRFRSKTQPDVELIDIPHKHCATRESSGKDCRESDTQDTFGP